MKRLHELLRQVDRSTGMGIVINIAISQGNIDELVQVLHGQAIDDERAMTKVIGTEAVALLMKVG